MQWLRLFSEVFLFTEFGNSVFLGSSILNEDVTAQLLTFSFHPHQRYVFLLWLNKKGWKCITLSHIVAFFFIIKTALKMHIHFLGNLEFHWTSLSKIEYSLDVCMESQNSTIHLIIAESSGSWMEKVGKGYLRLIFTVFLNHSHVAAFQMA